MSCDTVEFYLVSTISLPASKMSLDTSFISFDTEIVRRASVFKSVDRGSMLLFSLEKGKYYGSGAVGDRVMQLAKTPITVASLCNILLDEFDVDPEVCYSDVLSFVKLLYQNNLIDIVDLSK